MERVYDNDYCLVKVQESDWVPASVPEDMMTHELCLAAVKENGQVVRYVPDHLMTPELRWIADR